MKNKIRLLMTLLLFLVTKDMVRLKFVVIVVVI